MKLVLANNSKTGTSFIMKNCSTNWQHVQWIMVVCVWTDRLNKKWKAEIQEKRFEKLMEEIKFTAQSLQKLKILF